MAMPIKTRNSDFIMALSYFTSNTLAITVPEDFHKKVSRKPLPCGRGS